MSCLPCRNPKKGKQRKRVVMPLIPLSLHEISPILKFADEIQARRPRVAFLCRFYAFERSQKLDPASIGEGVSIFKSALLGRLERDDLPSLMGRVKRSDEEEIKSILKHYSRNYLEALEKYKDKPNH
ncbi:hypothetical protein MKX03_006368 [Papaver bracteatum]|nr:hypothetical protein MKX03_006368 [Papaver bracteatum]